MEKIANLSKMKINEKKQKNQIEWIKLLEMEILLTKDKNI